MRSETKNNSDGPDWLTIAQVAERLQITNQTARRLIARGELRAIRVSKRIRISHRDYQAFVAARYAETDGAA